MLAYNILMPAVTVSNLCLCKRMHMCTIIALFPVLLFQLPLLIRGAPFETLLQFAVLAKEITGAEQATSP